MSRVTVTLRPADGATGLSYVEELLAGAGLPVADVRANPDVFYVAVDGGERVGVGGLEVHGSAGLLRSLVVEDGLRGDGYGTAICEGLEARARATGVELWLLTTTAAGFFTDRGYRRVERSAAPAAIRGTTEFEDLCPDSATCMVASP